MSIHECHDVVTFDSEYGELYDEEFSVSQTSYTYDDDPHVDVAAGTWLYGWVYVRGWKTFPAIDLECEILAEPPW
jgi:hypothetical protein